MRLADANAPVRALLDGYRAEREELLRKAQAALERDARVGAAWLFGSIGRGEEDDLSDLDVFVVVADASLDTLAQQRHAYVAQIGTPVLLLEAPQNAPPQGAYLMALYEGQSGPHQVDWYWQAQSAARVPQQTRVLFDRVGLLHLDTPPQFDYQPVPERTPQEAATQDVHFFWVMLLITAKYVARSPSEQGMGLLKWAVGALESVQRFVGATPAPISEDAAAVTDFTEKLRILRALASEMQTWMPEVVARGGNPSPEIVPQAYLYLDFVEAIARHRPKPSGGACNS